MYDTRFHPSVTGIYIHVKALGTTKFMVGTTRNNNIYMYRDLCHLHIAVFRSKLVANVPLSLRTR